MNGLALRFTWGEHRLHSEVLKPGRRAFTVGSAAGVDFPCSDVAGVERFTLVPHDDTRTVRFARGMAGVVWRAEVERSLQQSIESGEAMPDGDGYALTLGPRDAVRLQLKGIAVEAMPVPVAKAVKADVLGALDLRMVNILVAVLVMAGAAIVGAVTREGSEYADDLMPVTTKTLAHWVAPPPPPAKAQAPAVATPEKKPSKEGAAPKQKVAEKPSPAARGKDPKAVAAQLGAALDDVFKGRGVAGDPLGIAVGRLENAAVAANGGKGLGLRGDASGGGPGETIGIGGIDRPGHGHGPGDRGPSSIGNPLTKAKPQIDVVTTGDVSTCCGMDKDLIREVIHRHRSEVRYCYELQLTKNPSLEGKTSVKFMINGTGAVSSSSVVESTVRSSELETCVAGRVRTWQFPKPPGGSSVIVTYPFVFRATGR